MTTLTLPEKLLLLALNNETGERSVDYVDYSLGGAALAELILRGVLVPSPDKADRFEWGNDQPTGDRFLDDCRDIIRKAGLKKDAKTLVSAIGKVRGVSQPLVDRLIERGILKRQTKKFLLFFTKIRHPEADPAAEQALKERLSAVMFGHGDVSPEDTVLVALAKNMNLLKSNFDRDLLKRHKARIDAIAKGDELTATATKAAVEAVHAAVLVAVILPAVFVVTVTS